jgi:hypothetical protein
LELPELKFAPPRHANSNTSAIGRCIDGRTFVSSTAVGPLLVQYNRDAGVVTQMYHYYSVPATDIDQCCEPQACVIAWLLLAMRRVCKAITESIDSAARVGLKAMDR